MEYQINKDLENGVYKPKSHPGRTGLSLVELPERIQNSIKTAVKGIAIDRLKINDSSALLQIIDTVHIFYRQTDSAAYLRRC